MYKYFRYAGRLLVATTRGDIFLVHDGDKWYLLPKSTDAKAAIFKNTRYYKISFKMPDGSSKMMYVHKAIATLFIRPPEKGEDVHHINGNSLDNRVENLAIIDAALHRSLSRKQQKRTFIRKYSSIDVYVKASGKKYRFKTMAEASRALGMDRGYINSYVRYGVYENRKYRWVLNDEKEILLDENKR